MAGPSLMATLGANIAPFISNLEQAKSHAKSEGESIASALGEELSSKLAAFGSIVGLEEYVRRTVEWASSMGDLSIRTGMAVTELQAMQNIAAISGSSVEALASLYERLGKAMANPDNRAMLERLGVSQSSIDMGDMKAATQELATYIQNIGAITPQIEADLAKVYKNAREAIPALKAMTQEAMDNARATTLPPEFMAELKTAGDDSITMLQKVSLVGKTAVSGLATVFNTHTTSAHAAWAALTTDSPDALATFGSVFDAEREKVYKLAEELKGQTPEQAAIAALQGRVQVERDKLSKDQASHAPPPTIEAIKAELAAISSKRQSIAGQYTGVLGPVGDMIEASLQLREAQLANERNARQKIDDKAERERAADESDAYLDAAKRLDELKKEEKKFAERKMADYEVNSLQKIGGVLGSFPYTNEIQMVEVQKKS